MFDDKFDEIIKLDDELLKGSVFINEWCVTIVREADNAYVSGVYLGAILTAVAGIETHMRAELQSKKRLVELINEYNISESVKKHLHELRRYRNQWVHVDTEDSYYEFDDEVLTQLKEKAYQAIRLLRQVLYANPCI
ncbi:hypothetical protein KW537_11880 [Vibrio fluvialis]|nr:hypothetical protein [Vibrio fluvialis]